MNMGKNSRSLLAFTITALERIRGGAVGCGTALQAERSRVRIPLVSLEIFLLTQSFRPHYSPEFDSACNRNK
jgi:hypothetical protein